MNAKNSAAKTQPVARRRLLAALGGIVALPFLPHTPAAMSPRVPIQTSPIAGFQYHEGEHVWNLLRPGDPLYLVREPNNKYDRRAVRLDWRNYKLGYVPRDENAAVSQMLDRTGPSRGNTKRRPLRNTPR